MENFSNRLKDFLDLFLKRQRKLRPPRTYLGASLMGDPCLRKIQFSWCHPDQSDQHSGQTLRIFDMGETIEQLAASWIRLAGFDLQTLNSKNGKQFGFSTAENKFQGHVDGIIFQSPKSFHLKTPMIWECKGLNEKSFSLIKKHGVKVARPQYATQIALYQAYMEPDFPGVGKNPALITVINKNNSDLYSELLDFDSEIAQKASDRVVQVLKATNAREILPRISQNPEYFVCNFCEFKKFCWEGS